MLHSVCIYGEVYGFMTGREEKTSKQARINFSFPRSVGGAFIWATGEAGRLILHARQIFIGAGYVTKNLIRKFNEYVLLPV